MSSDLYRQNFKLIDWSKPLPEVKREAVPERRSDLPCPLIIGDAMPLTQSMVDGSWHTSKSGIRATYKPSGNREGKEYTELGTEKQKPFQRPPIDRKQIKDVLDKAEAKVNRGDVSAHLKHKL